MADTVPEVHEWHPFVHHYTSKDGLEGIISTQTLFATNYRYLNDTSEIEHMRKALIVNLQHFVKSWFRERYTGEEIQKRLLTRHGGEHIIAYKQAKEIVDTAYKVAFEGEAEVCHLANPFITSFCSHSDGDAAYERENGLLSQWRGYAGIRESGGFAIVFDTRELAEVLNRENDFYYLNALLFGDVVYDGDTDGFHREFGGLLQKLEEMSGEVISGRQWIIPDLFDEFVSGVSRFKHRAFREEREVRITISPVTPELYEDLRETDPVYWAQDKSFKELIPRTNAHKPTIRLFDFDKKQKLPIVKIIVGPRRDQSENLEFAKALVEQAGMDVEIRTSETPYTGE